LPDHLKRRRIETEAIVIGYAMSRLDSQYLAARQSTTWQQVYEEAANALSLPLASFKNLRDEFDPLHSNVRRGWHNRPLRSNRQRVLEELREVSDEALSELVARILNRDEEATAEAIDSLAVVTHVAYNVAERLLTGRRAEDFFLANSLELVKVDPCDILDLRQEARGFDFGVQRKPEWAIEVKGLKRSKGEIQFTDREWTEAGRRGQNYWLVVVGNLNGDPLARIIQDPHGILSSRCIFQKTVSVAWRSVVSVQPRIHTERE
jgi:hypothetical protein